MPETGVPGPPTPSASTTPTSPAAAPPIRPGTGGKARPGELRALIAQVLAANPAAMFTVTELARMLGHSGGAVGNACETLAGRGEAERVGSKPRMYRATSSTPTAAQRASGGPPTRAPSPPCRTNPTGKPLPLHLRAGGRSRSSARTGSATTRGRWRSCRMWRHCGDYARRRCRCCCTGRRARGRPR